MPRRDPPAEYRFKPGQSGNPGGKPATPPDLKAAKNLTRIELERLLNKFINMPRGELAAYAKKEDATAMELMMASIVSKAVLHGDHQRLDFLLNRMVGKVADKLELARIPDDVIADEIERRLTDGRTPPGDT